MLGAATLGLVLVQRLGVRWVGSWQGRPGPDAVEDESLERLLLGGGGGDLRDLADVAVVVPSSDTQHIQEVQIVVIHLLCELVEAALAGGAETNAVRGDERRNGHVGVAR